MHKDTQQTRLMIKLPRDVKEWLEVQAAYNASSQASEIVRAVRERMERVSSRKMEEVHA